MWEVVRERGWGIYSFLVDLSGHLTTLSLMHMAVFGAGWGPKEQGTQVIGALQARGLVCSAKAAC